MRTHADKMKVVHAIWLLADLYPKDTEAVEALAAQMLRIPLETLWNDFGHDYLDRAWCSRPIDWKPTDSLA